jgi:hypothetical protein
MKKLLLTTALSLTAPFAFAEQPASGSPQHAPGAAAAFSQIDTDRDGVISKQEASSFSALEVMFDDADANRDGALDADEFSRTQRKGGN